MPKSDTDDRASTTQVVADPSDRLAVSASHGAGAAASTAREVGRARRQALALMVASGLVSLLVLYGLWLLLRAVV